VSERLHLLLTCEHASNAVPRTYSVLFPRDGRVLRSHRGFDIGALAVARHLSRALRAPLYAGSVTRLVVDLNRSLGHRHLHSEFLADVERAQRLEIVERYHAPHWETVEQHVAGRLRRGVWVVHVAVHSFTPALRGEVRNADVGLLYDPSRRREALLCRGWKEILAETAPALRVRFNYPYRGVSDGLTTWLRRRFPAGRYVGVELEMNQRRLQAPADRAALAGIVARSLRRLLAS
jgi:predicted N-formylglutamate amidohydrolase